MRSLDYATGEIQRLVNTAALDGAASRSAAAALIPPLCLPTVSEQVPVALRRNGNLTLLGHLGTWMTELGWLTPEQWNANDPVSCIQRRFREKVCEAIGKAGNSLWLETTSNPDVLLEPNCGLNLAGKKHCVVLSLSTSGDRLFRAPLLGKLAKEDPRAAAAIAGLIETAITDSVGSFGPAMAMDHAFYYYWCGELSYPLKDIAEADEEARELMQSGTISEDAVLPSQVAVEIPECLCNMGIVPMPRGSLASYPDVSKAYRKLLQVTKAWHRLNNEEGRVSAIGFGGELNYDRSNFWVWTPAAEEDATDYVVELFDEHNNQLMQSGESLSTIGTASIHSAKELAQWLESLECLGKVIVMAEQLLETLK